MKNIYKFLCIAFSVIVLFSFAGCAKKEATTGENAQINTEINKENKENEETYSNIVLTLDKEKNVDFSINISDRFKDVLSFKSSNDGKTIFATDKDTNTVIFKILISDKKDNSAVVSKKLNSYVLNVFNGDEINDSYDSGKLLKEIQDNAKTIIETAKASAKTPTPDNADNEDNKDSNENNDEFENSVIKEDIEKIKKEEEEKLAIETKEDGTKIYRYTSENGEVQEFVEYPDPFDKENQKPVFIDR